MSEEPTTPDLLDLVRGAFEAAKRRDFDAMVSYYAPDAVWDLSALGLDSFEGHVAIRDHFEDWFDPYENWTSKLDEASDLGHGVVLLVTHEYARMRGGSGVIPRRVAFVWEFVDGLIVRATPYTDIDQARAAAERLAEERG